MHQARSENVRAPAVAEWFYPGDARALRAQVEDLLAAARPAPLRPRALIAPHAGYAYSGPVAASAHALLRPLRATITRVVLLGPSHYVGFAGLALPGVQAFATPLGEIELDAEAAGALAGLDGVRTLPEAHAREHSLEVHLPFLQVALAQFRLLALAVGDATAAQVAAVLERTWGGDETVVVVSSDLSHYRPYGAAVAIDGETAAAIRRLDATPIDGEHACGCRAIAGLLRVARSRGLRVVEIDRRNSGDTAGDRDRVVGYGAWAFSEAT